MKSNSYVRIGHLAMRRLNGLLRSEFGDVFKNIREGVDYEEICREVGKSVVSIVCKEMAQEAEVVEPLTEVELKEVVQNIISKAKNEAREI